MGPRGIRHRAPQVSAMNHTAFVHLDADWPTFREQLEFAAKVDAAASGRPDLIAAVDKAIAVRQRRGSRRRRQLWRP